MCEYGTLQGWFQGTGHILVNSVFILQLMMGRMLQSS